ncbi:CaiB/BaiF CoA transferase family protein [Undibacterium parvum]|uniref:CoA transferase n=1 Tax=Undibacterium parvum TaxID=401471 RepID=A0A3S9HPB2_9BURK|nr:CaiB/BaiF CoA-transferase family protein [Undibacterium parvum]AZP13931.1 CoA transferase [Undibacterium parvum]
MSLLPDIKVLDLTRVLAGPWCTQILADYGATVIKIEKPGVGDDTRHWGPPYAKDADGNLSSEAAYYLSANRGKQSVTLDFSKPAGAALLRQLILQADVLIENYKVGSLQKYGLDYESLKSLNPRLIYCSITGFGQTGPYAERAGYDFAIQGIGGLMSITGERADLPGGGPQKVGVAVVDVMTGMYASSAILAALTNRASSGLGRYIDVALLDVQVAMLANVGMNYLVSETLPKRWGNAHPNIVPYQTFPTADGEIVIAIGNDSQFRNFCKVLGKAEWSADTRFCNNPARVQHREILIPMITEQLAHWDKFALAAALEALGVPCGPINNLAQVFVDPQVQARAMRVDVPHPSAGSVPQVRHPVQFSGDAIAPMRAPPLLGQHTEQVLQRMLGLDIEQIAHLRAQGLI